MRQLIFVVRYENLTTAPTGTPPTFTVHAKSDEVMMLQGEPDDAPSWINYDTTVIMTGSTTLQETGTMTLGDDDDWLDVATLGDGYFLPSAIEGLMQGTVMWGVTAGHGRLKDATGVITGNFTHDLAAGAGREFQVLNLFVT